MRVVLDTNIVVSGFLWRSSPRQIIDLARSSEITLCTSQALLDELITVINRAKFAKNLAYITSTPQEVINSYTALAEIVEVENVESVVSRDPDDDEVVDCAVAANASYIISGDSDLLNLGTYRDLKILTATEFLTELRKEG